jgi:hypothetical protein
MLSDSAFFCNEDCLLELIVASYSHGIALRPLRCGGVKRRCSVLAFAYSYYRDGARRGEERVETPVSPLAREEDAVSPDSWKVVAA